MRGVYSCEDCLETYYPDECGVDPPCNICPMPKAKLTQKNLIYWNIWCRLNAQDRPIGMSVGPLPSPAILEVLRLYGAETIEDYETICFIESMMYAFLLEQQKEASESKKDK